MLVCRKERGYVYGKYNSNRKTYVQCTQCGKVYTLNKYIPFEIDYLKSFCPDCSKATKHLNLGQNEEDKYIYMDVNIDSRYY